MKTRLLAVVVLAAVFCAKGVFAEVVIKAEVDKTNIVTDERINYKVTVTSTEKDTPRPQIPKFDGFAVFSQSQASSFSFTKEGLKTTLEFSYILAPLEEGSFKIAPATIKIKDQIFSTESFQVEVKKGQAQPQLPPEKTPFKIPEDKQETELPQITL